MREKIRPYGAGNDESTFDKWLSIFKLTYRPGHACVHWVAKGRCGVRNCRNMEFDWMDHPSSYFTESRERIMLYQPYGIRTPDLISIQNTAKEFNLQILIDGDGWYGHGTVAIWLRSAPPSTTEKEEVENERSTP